jgi:cephalosporin hydroxylase
MQGNPLEQFRKEATKRAASYQNNKPLQEAYKTFFEQLGIGKANYAFNFFWLGVPIIQIPQDLQALQEIIWEAKPDLIIETGIAWGGSLMFSASMLVILEACGVIENGQVLGIDIEIRAHNKAAILAHPLSKKITMFEGSSVDAEIIAKVKAFAQKKKRVMVCLDSNHTHDHVLAELRAYAPLVSVGSYCMVGDTVIEGAPEGMLSNRPWGKGNNPKTAVWAFLKENSDFVIDKTIDSKLIITGSPEGYLKRLR